MSETVHVRDVMTPDHPAVRKSDSVLDAIDRMVADWATCIAILDEDRSLYGVLNVSGVPRLVSERRDLARMRRRNRPKAAERDEPP